MSIKTYRPTTPGRRQMTVSGFDGVDKHAAPEKSLTEVLKKNAGRNSYGRITVRHQGGGNRQKYRVAHEVARAVNFREATFSGMLDAPQQDGKMAWLVTTFRVSPICVIDRM